MPLIGGRSRAVCKIWRSGKPWIEAAKKRLHFCHFCHARRTAVPRSNFLDGGLSRAGRAGQPTQGQG